jgi:hypothetical protein
MSESIPGFVLAMPAVYEFRTDRDDKNDPIFAENPWMKWGWCDARQFSLGLNYRFHPQGILWGVDELFDRFAWTPISPSFGGVKPLQIFHKGKHEFDKPKLVTLDEYKCMSSTGAPYVPAGWAKAVLKAVAAGACRVEVVEIGPRKFIGWLKDGQHQMFIE